MGLENTVAINPEKHEETFRSSDIERPFAMTVRLVRSANYPNRDAWISVQPLLRHILVGYEPLDQRQIMARVYDRCSRPGKYNYGVMEQLLFAARDANRLATLSGNQAERSVQEYKAKKYKALSGFFDEEGHITDEYGLKVHQEVAAFFEQDLVDGRLASVSMPLS